ncbi:accessory gene regulator B family protein [Paenibacillus sp. PAMC 26794]|uniref:accessory gene regulator B family protein n=1 Tax=Paenibacillus sp. PAMC 26794 TaxID=1257080 RepID=UPI00037A1472|nr:accessory gene regulator B family protein [Paenibacillus sp. PAMC 26794]
MIELVSRKFAMSVKRAYPPANEEVIAYEVGRQLNLYSIVILTIVFSLLIGQLIGSIVAMCTFAFARKITGGLHLKLTLCTIVTVSLFIIAPVIPMSTFSVVILSVLVSFFYMGLRREQSRWLIVIVSLANVNILSSEITLVLMAQLLLVWAAKIKGGENVHE